MVIAPWTAFVGADRLGWMRVVAGLSLVSLLSGCSFMFAQRPPPDHERRVYFDCPSDDAAPTADVAAAVLTGLVTANALVDDPDSPGNDVRGDVAWIFGTTAALATASAVYGFITTSNCGWAKEQLQQRLLRAEAERARDLEEETFSQPLITGCVKDVECKGERICVDQTCVDPPRLLPPTPPPVEAPVVPAEPPVSPASPDTAPADGVIPPPVQSFPEPAAPVYPKPKAPILP